MNSLEPRNIHDLESVKVFLMAARHGNIRGAAKELGVSVSTASRRIQTLEESLGAKLLIRRAEGVIPTDVGRRVLDASTELDNVARRLSLIAMGLKRDATITFTATDGIAGYWLPILLAKFPEDHPEISLQVRCRDVGRGADVSAAESDVDVTYFPPEDPDLVVLGKASMPVRMFASDGYAAKYGLPETLEEIVDHRVCIMDSFLVPNVGNGDWNRYAAILAGHPRITYQVNSALALGFAIRSGWGIGVQPALVESTEPGMLMLPDEVYMSTLQFWLVAHMDVKDNPAPRLLAQWLKERMIRSFKDGRATFEIDT